MSTPPSPARRWWTLWTVSLVQFMVTLDITVMNIALPKAQIDLGFTTANRQWLITAYALAFGSLMLVGGRLADLWGRRTALIIGLVGFGLASGAGAMVHTFTELVAARAAQGACGALMAPSALALLATSFSDRHERAKAFSLFGAVSGSGAALGLIIGAALTQYATWRWCQWCNVPVVIVALLGVMVSTPHDSPSSRRSLDVVGALLGSSGVFLIVFGFANAVNAGWANRQTWLSLAGAVLVVVVFFWRERHATAPLLTLATLRQRTRLGALIALFVTSLGTFVLSLLLAYYLENVLHDSPMMTGLLFAPLVAALLLSVSVGSARLFGQVGPRPLIPVGLLLIAMGMVLLTRITTQADYVVNVLPALVLTGLGLGLVVAPATASAVHLVENEDAGVASGLVNTTQQVGVAVGVALLNTIAVSVSRRYWDAHPALTAYQQGVVRGDAVAFWWTAGFFGAAAVATFLLLESDFVDG